MAVYPSVQVCIICLDTDSKLYRLRDYSLEELYKQVTGLSLHNEENMLSTLCTECAYRLLSCYRFKDKSVRAYTLLTELNKTHELTIPAIKTVNRVNNQLTSSLVKKIYEPDYCDLYILHHEHNHKKIEIDKNICSSIVESIVKREESDDISNLVSKENTFSYVSIKKDLKHDVVDINNDIDVDKTKNEKVVRNYNVCTLEFIEENNSTLQVLNENVKDMNNKHNKNAISHENVKGIKSEMDIHNKMKVNPVVSRKTFKAKPDLKLFKVIDLNYEEQVADVKKRQEMASYKRSKYKCTVCFTGFVNKNSHSRHIVKHTERSGEYTCALCTMRFTNRHKISDHIKKCHSRTYSCTSCVYITKYRQSAELHERWHNGAKYKCPKCNEEFDALISYMSHHRRKHPSDFICSLCGNSFISKKGIAHHMLLKHRFENVEISRGPECVPCNVRFASEAAYNQHVKMSPKHNADGGQARKDFSVRYRGLAGDIACEECGLHLKDVIIYKKHFKRYHPDKNPTKHSPTEKCYLCEHCGKGYKYRSLLDGHMAVHVRQQPNAPTFECPICKKTFWSKGNRDRHKWIHKEKSFQCEVCDKTFSTISEMRRHVAHVHLKKPWPKKIRGPKRKNVSDTT